MRVLTLLLLLGFCFNLSAQINYRVDSNQRYQIKKGTNDSLFSHKYIWEFDSKGLLSTYKTYRPDEVSKPKQGKLTLTEKDDYVFDKERRWIERTMLRKPIHTDLVYLTHYVRLYTKDRMDQTTYSSITGDIADTSLSGSMSEITLSPTKIQIDRSNVEDGVLTLAYRTYRFGDPTDLDSLHNYTCNGEDQCVLSYRSIYEEKGGYNLQTTYLQSGRWRKYRTRNYNDTLETRAYGQANPGDSFKWLTLTHTRELGNKTIVTEGGNPGVDSKGNPIDLVMVNFQERETEYVNEKTERTYFKNFEWNDSLKNWTLLGSNVKYWTALPSGFDDEKQAHGPSIYPNPVKNMLNIKSGDAISRVEVFTIDGRRLYEQSGKQKTIDVSRFSPGVYSIRVHHNKSISTARFVKAN